MYMIEMQTYVMSAQMNSVDQVLGLNASCCSQLYGIQ